MKNFIDFFQKLGKLRETPRRGWVLIGAKNPATIVDHTFRLAIMSWLLAEEKKTKFNIEKILKISLVHDICELYAGDITPYDYGLLPKDKKKWPELFDKWPRYPKKKKMKNSFSRHKEERDSLKKVISKLSPKIKKEILDLWLDYEKGTTKEGRFVRQVNRLETLFQAIEYGKEMKKRPYKSWWIGTEERVDDPVLLEFMHELGKKFHP